MKKKRFIQVLIVAAGTLIFSACTSSSKSAESTGTTQKTTESSIDLNALELPQLETAVQKNEDLVELTTTEGSIKIKLFPEIAPKAVENFMTHAKEGYYDGLTFHRIIEDFMIQGGDPKGDGTGGESIWGEGFGEEISKQLYHLRGALAMAKSQAPNSQGSQFFILQNHDDVSDGLAIQHYPKKIIEAYKNGGYPSLDGSYTVFGQVTEGMDVVDKIAQAETAETASASGENSTPKNPVKIEKITILQEAE